MSVAFTGVALRLYIKGKYIGWATGVSINARHMNQIVEVLGKYDIKEIVPTGRRVSLSARVVRVVGDGLRELGVWPSGTNIEMITWPPMVIEVYNEVEDVVLFKMGGCRAENATWQADKHTVSALNATWLGTRLEDESTVSQSA